MDIEMNNAASLNLADSVFGAEYNEALVHQVVVAYMNGGRAGTKAQKSKAMVSGGGKKPWKQKGTGRARAGSIRSPLWRGGGKTFAAVPRDFSQKVNRKMYRGAMRSIFSELLRRGDLTIAEQFAVSEPKTKAFLSAIEPFGDRDLLIITSEVNRELFLSSRNVPHVGLSDVESLNPVALLRHKKVVVTAEAAKKIEGWLA
ncbi:MAG: 50S ribosomal protein L4 [Polycyclovorans sp.]|nr:50S ribosomal protein L4 [Polycyclovorans sp.]|tara:strand:+ start:1134 stop:1736 length:603 start_codon:yes stop_codon:yes gene_type:complete